MVAFVIFWAAFLCLTFFLLGVIFKGLASAFSALLSSLASILVIVFYAGAGALVLSLIYDIVDGIITRGLSDVIGTIITFVIVIALIVGLLGGLGAALLGLVAAIGISILEVVFSVLEGAATSCEKVYCHFLLVITNRLEKC